MTPQEIMQSQINHLEIVVQTLAVKVKRLEEKSREIESKEIKRIRLEESKANAFCF